MIYKWLTSILLALLLIIAGTIAVSVIPDCPAPEIDVECKNEWALATQPDGFAAPYFNCIDLHKEIHLECMKDKQHERETLLDFLQSFNPFLIFQ